MRWGQLRRAVLERDDYTCQYCGHRPDRLQIVVPFFGDVVRRGTLHVDHITPRAQGGLDVIENLVTACESCNLRKNANTWPAPIAYCIDCRVLHRDLEVTTLGPCGPEWCCSDCLATVAEDND